MTRNKKNYIWKYIGIISSISSILGLILTIYYFNLSKEGREPFFIEDTVKSILVDSSKVNNAPFKIFRINGEEINENVTSSTIYFWNQGRKPIKQKDVLDSLTIELPSECEILKCEIIEKSREICDFRLRQITRNKVKLDFRIIEELDGFMAQIIYIGSPKIKAKFNGHIEGVKKINLVPKSNIIFKLLFRTLVISVLLVLIFCLGLFLYIKYKDNDDTVSIKGIILLLFNSEDKWSTVLFLFLVLILALMTSELTTKTHENIGDLIPKEIQIIK